jgi:hypothetical protein
VPELADIADVSRPPAKDGQDPVAPMTTSPSDLRCDGFAPLTSVPVAAWRRLTERAIEPNGYYLPAWELAVNASAHGRTGVSALSAWSEPSPNKLAPTGAQPGLAQQPDEGARLIGLLPVVSLWRACKIPLPALASASPYGTLCTPLLDRTDAENAAKTLMDEARRAGAHALVLRDVSLNGAAMKALTQALRQQALQPIVLHSHLRACLDARRAADDVLRDALSAKKLKAQCGSRLRESPRRSAARSKYFSR